MTTRKPPCPCPLAGNNPTKSCLYGKYVFLLPAAVAAIVISFPFPFPFPIFSPFAASVEIISSLLPSLLLLFNRSLNLHDRCFSATDPVELLFVHRVGVDAGVGVLGVQRQYVSAEIPSISSSNEESDETDDLGG